MGDVDDATGQKITDHQPKPGDLLDKGESLLDNGVKGKANDEAKKALAKIQNGKYTENCPFDIICEFLEFVMKKQYGEALVMCDKILEFEPENGIAKEFRGVLVEMVAEDGPKGDGDALRDDEDGDSSSSSDEADSSSTSSGIETDEPTASATSTATKTKPKVSSLKKLLSLYESGDGPSTNGLAKNNDPLEVFFSTEDSTDEENSSGDESISSEDLSSSSSSNADDSSASSSTTTTTTSSSSSVDEESEENTSHGCRSRNADTTTGDITTKTTIMGKGRERDDTLDLVSSLDFEVFDEEESYLPMGGGTWVDEIDGLEQKKTK